MGTYPDGNGLSTPSECIGNGIAPRLTRLARQGVFSEHMGSRNSIKTSSSRHCQLNLDASHLSNVH
jgi:hypothetical protein